MFPARRTPDPFTRLVLRVDPIAHTLSAGVNEAALGPFAMDLAAPHIVGIEGVGMVDDVVARKAP